METYRDEPNPAVTGIPLHGRRAELVLVVDCAADTSLIEALGADADAWGEPGGNIPWFEVPRRTVRRGREYVLALEGGKFGYDLAGNEGGMELGEDGEKRTPCVVGGVGKDLGL